MRAKADHLPRSARLHSFVGPNDFIDCYSVELGPKASQASIDDLARGFATTMPDWAQALMDLRNVLVKPLGLRTEFEGEKSQKGECKPGELINIFRVYHRDDDEILMGDDDIHLNYRISIYRAPDRPDKIYAATWVHRNNWVGHSYLFLVMPFHKVIVKSMATRGARTML